MPKIRQHTIYWLFLQLAILIPFPGTVASTMLAQSKPSPRLIHVIVALCDNEHQGIYPVSEALGDGDNPGTNLYWGALYGVRTYLNHQPAWRRIASYDSVSDLILQRVIYAYSDSSNSAILVADAYRGERIDSAMNRFIYEFSRLTKVDSIVIDSQLSFDLARSSLIAYVGHNGLMDFNLPIPLMRADTSKPIPDVMALACFSRNFLSEYVQRAGVTPVLWSSGLCSPEAYTLEAAIKGWIKGESKPDIRTRSAEAYDKFQKCGLKAARNLWVN